MCSSQQMTSDTKSAPFNTSSEDEDAKTGSVDDPYESNQDKDVNLLFPTPLKKKGQLAITKGGSSTPERNARSIK